MRWEELLVGALLGAVAAIAIEVFTGGLFRLGLYRWFRAWRFGPAPKLDVRTMPPSADRAVTWVHIEVANSPLRWPITDEAERVSAIGTLDDRASVTFLWDALGPPTQFRDVARDEWATIPLALRAHQDVNVWGNDLAAGVSYLTDASFFVHKKPIALSPGRHTVSVSIRPRADDAVPRRFTLTVPPVVGATTDLEAEEDPPRP
jgi:hypothetical protein